MSTSKFLQQTGVKQPDFTDLSGTATSGQIPNLPASKITSGTIGLAQGGTNADLSGSGSATAVLAQDGSHVVSARSLVAADYVTMVGDSGSGGTKGAAPAPASGDAAAGKYLSAGGTYTSPVLTNALWLPRRQTLITTDTSSTTFQCYGDVITASFSGGGTGANAASATQESNLGGNAGNATVGSWSSRANYRYGKNLSLFCNTSFVRITNERFWVCLTDQTAATMGGSDNPAGNYVGFFFSTPGGFSTIYAASKDNSTQTATNTLITPVAVTGLNLAIVCNDSVPNATFYINGAVVATHTTHLPTSGTNLAWVVTTLTNVNNTNGGIEIGQALIQHDSY